MKRIYILPYTNKTFFSSSKRNSGIETAALAQFNVLTELGYDVRIYTAIGDLHHMYGNIDFFIDSLPENCTAKEYEKANRNRILAHMLLCIREHKPDIIYSNFEFGKFYAQLANLNIPIMYNSHANPGFWSDLTFANDLNRFCLSGNSLCCVSEYHRKKTLSFYSNTRKTWDFKNITPDHVLYPQFCNKENVVVGDGSIKHCSVAHKDKKTFLIHQYLEDTEIPSEVFTSINFYGTKVNDPYVTEGLEKYCGPQRITNVNVNHADIVKSIGQASAAFVGLAPYDTFTITSLEALSRGVPLLVKGTKGEHPAKEMIEPSLSKYVYIIENRKDFLVKAQEFIMLPLEIRQQIADSTYNMMSKDKYCENIQSVLEKSIKKFKDKKVDSSLFESFM